jgi:4-hydroxy-tetrahydrodipicolinate reductase
MAYGYFCIVKIALIGYGKMGREIETIALDKGHEIVHKFDSANPATVELLKQADVAIEFSRPENAVKHLHLCLEAGIPVVCGTTGWYAEYDFIAESFHKQGGSLFTATNFSIGVNITFYLNKKLAAIMNKYQSYAAGIEEIHHTKKLDSPSGTAITLAEGILHENNRFDHWALSESNRQNTAVTLPIHAVRRDDVPGTHTVTWDSEIDRIDITHTAHSRKGFASGAVLAAEWLLSKTGVYKMDDMLNFEN